MYRRSRHGCLAAMVIFGAVLPVLAMATFKKKQKLDRFETNKAVIFEFLHKEKKPLSIGEIAKTLGFDRNTVSRHTAILKAENKVTLENKANGKFYQIKLPQESIRNEVQNLITDLQQIDKMQGPLPPTTAVHTAVNKWPSWDEAHGDKMIFYAVFELLRKHPGKRFNVDEVAKAVKIDRNTASRHLSVLEAQKYLTMNKVSNGKYFEISLDPLQKTQFALEDILSDFRRSNRPGVEITVIENTLARLNGIHETGQPPSELQAQTIRVANQLAFHWGQLAK